VLELKVSKQESLQLQAANKAINGDFDQAVSLMKESLGVQANENPFWVFQAPITIEMTGVAKEIGNVFLYNRINDERFGVIAASILKGDYGVAVQLMIEEIRKDRLMKAAEELPEDMVEMVEYLKTHSQIRAANDAFIPIWVK